MSSAFEGGHLYSLVHEAHGPIATLETQADAERELAAVLEGEPSLADALSVEERRFG